MKKLIKTYGHLTWIKINGKIVRKDAINYIDPDTMKVRVPGCEFTLTIKEFTRVVADLGFNERSTYHSKF